MKHYHTKVFSLTLLASGNQFLQEGLVNVIIHAKLLPTQVLLAKGVSDVLKVLLHGAHDGHNVVLAGVAIHADVLHRGTHLQLCLHFPKGHVLSKL